MARARRRSLSPRPLNSSARDLRSLARRFPATSADATLQPRSARAKPFPRGRGPCARSAAALLLVLALACTPIAPFASPAPRPDIGRSRIDIVFSGLIHASYYKPSGRDLLTAALDAIKREARATGGGDDDVATPTFDGSRAAFIADFRKFVAAAEQLAAKNPQLEASRISRVAIQAMLTLNPDCHNFYVPRSRSLREPSRWDGARRESERSELSAALTEVRGEAALRKDDGRSREAAGVPGREGRTLNGVAALAAQGVQFRMLPGNVGYLAWREFDIHVVADIQKSVDTLVAQGARAWLFDVRNNVGGEGAQTIVSWFVKGGPVWREVDRNGIVTPHTAKEEFFLPQTYQLPIAVVVNGRTFSDAELFTLGLQARGRARVFGTKTGGCFGSIMQVTLPDGAHVGIAQSVFIGPFSDAPLNNVGLLPDVVITSGDPLDSAAAFLRSLSD